MLVVVLVMLGISATNGTGENNSPAEESHLGSPKENKYWAWYGVMGLV